MQHTLHKCNKPGLKPAMKTMLYHTSQDYPHPFLCSLGRCADVGLRPALLFPLRDGPSAHAFACKGKGLPDAKYCFNTPP